MSTERVAPMVVEQALLFRALDGTIFPIAYSFPDEPKLAVWIPHIGRELPSGPPPSRAALTYVALPDSTYAMLLRWRAGAPGDTVVHALLGRSAELTPPLALTAEAWPGWRDPPFGGPLWYLPAHAIAVADAEHVLRARALVHGDLLVRALAWMLHVPRYRLGLIGCPEADRTALLWALHEIARTRPEARAVRDRSWTFSTHADPGAERSSAEVIFLDAAGPPRPDNRIIVDLRGQPDVLLPYVHAAQELVYRFDVGYQGTDQVAVIWPPHTATDSGPPPDAPSRYAELVRGLVTARTEAGVLAALDELDRVAADRDGDREYLRAELENAGWVTAVIDKHIAPVRRGVAYDRLVRNAFGTTAPGRETDNARRDARRLALSAPVDFVRALARAINDPALTSALAQRWIREHLPAEPDADADRGSSGRFLHRHRPSMNPARERRILVATVLVAVLVVCAIVYMLGFVAGGPA